MTEALSFFRSLAGRIFTILLVGTLLSASIALALADIKRRNDLDRINLERAADRTQYFYNLLDRAAEASRPPLAAEGDAGVRGVELSAATGPLEPEFTALLLARLGRAAQPEVRRADFQTCLLPEARAPPPDARIGPAPQCWVARARLRDSQQVAFAITAPPRADEVARGFDPLYLGVLAAAAAGLAFFVARMAARPWAMFARAASDLGRDLDRPPLPVSGADEVRAMAEAFNSMQADLKRHLEERTQMLAAITHDLQTPLTRLRLRLEKVQDEAVRERLIDDLEATEALIREGLELARSERAEEPMFTVDLTSLVESIAEDAADAGRPVSLIAAVRVYVLARPKALHRCLENLLDNAVAHGGSAEISLHAANGEAWVELRDHGSGIPEDKLEIVFEPFVRLESSRSRETGGAGLGLAIAKRLARQNAADLTLKNHPEGGLLVTLRLRTVA